MTSPLTRKELGILLENEIKNGYDLHRIAQWAYELHANSRLIEPSAEPELLKMMLMAEGPEFEISEKDLIALSNVLRQ